MKQNKIEEINKELTLIFSDLKVLADEDRNERSSSTRGPLGNFSLSNIGVVSKMKVASILFEESWINSNFTYKELDKQILNFCIENRTNDDKKDFLVLEKFLKELLGPEVEHTVISILRGVENVNVELTIGDFRIYPSKLIDKHIKCDNWERIKNDIITDFADEIMIETSVFSSDRERAKEIANERMDNFINILYFFLFAKKGGYSLRLGTSESSSIFINIINFSGKVYVHNKLDGDWKNVDLNEIINYYEEPLNKVLEIEKKLWFDRKNVNEMEKRIYGSIQWAGRALKEKYADEKFIQAMFGMEALIQEKNKNNVISPSIKSQMSEVIIFCLGDTYERRSEIEQEFKQLYTTRSNIAHGERTQVSEYESNLVLDYLRHIIFYFLKNDTFKTFKDVNEFIKNEKYKKM